MVPKLHAKGSSFRGAGAYLLHDKGRASSSDRVAWTEVKNLFSDDPRTAVKVMAATAMDQDRLKAAAGIKNTGRKSKDHVLHFTLSWHPDESAGVTREEMMRAAAAAIRALKADDRQALIVAHNDEPQAHVHVLLNRVSPADGRILSSSKEKLALSKFAEKYEKDRGQVYCPERVLNNAARERGEFTRGEKDQARHLHENAAANANQKPPASVLAEQKRKDAEVAKKAREIKERNAKAVRAVDEKHRQRLADIRAKARRDVVLAREAVREKFRSEWKANFHADLAEQSVFEYREASLVGRVQNALKAIDFGAIVRGQDRRRAITAAFETFAKAGARLEGLRRGQQARAREIAGRQKRDEHAAAVLIRGERTAAVAAARDAYTKERQTLDLTRGMDGARQRAAWKTRRQERAAEVRQLKESDAPIKPIVKAAVTRPPVKETPDVQAAFHRAAEPPPSARSQTEGDARAKLIEEFKKRMRDKNVGRDRDHDRDR